MPAIILPGATLGVFGSGQLGRMFALAAHELGYRVHVFSPEADTPTGLVAERETIASYDDHHAVEQFARSVDVVTLEFENVPVAALNVAEQFVPVRPGPLALQMVQDRLTEKEFLRSIGVPCAPFGAVGSLDQLHAALDQLSLPAVLKSRRMGYDGKGQAAIHNRPEAERAWHQLGQHDCVLEQFVDLRREASVLVARGTNGATACYGPIANEHQNHILDVSVLPAPVDETTGSNAAGASSPWPVATDHGPRTTDNPAVRIAQRIATALDVIGIVCVEFFETTAGDLLVNEIAPRPHNSGHLTIDACVASQFEQQVRAICGLPLGATDSLCPAAMANLLGDVWQNGEPAWQRALALPGVRLHLYGKRDPRPGRKMGHLTALADTPAEAADLARAARAALAP